MKAAYEVTGMHCQTCEEKLRELLLSSPHVAAAQVSLARYKAFVEGDPELSLTELNNRVAAAGDIHLTPSNEAPPAAIKQGGDGRSSDGQPEPLDCLVEGVEHDRERSRFVYSTDGRTSELVYERPADGVIELQHTYVPPPDRGEGIAARLTESALKYADAEHLRVEPTCSYVRNYIEENPRYESLTKNRANENADHPIDAASHAADGQGGASGSQHERHDHELDHTHHAEETWLATYYPLVLIVAFVAGGAVVAGAATGIWTAPFLMSMFMGLFFVAFSFFKMLDLSGFAEAYTSYDLVAARWLPYAYVYPFIELGLGVAYLIGVAPIAVNAATLVVMLVSTAGVVNAVMRGRDLQCGCLGTMFNLPMSTVTIVEDATMAVMAGVMLALLL